MSTVRRFPPLFAIAFPFLLLLALAPGATPAAAYDDAGWSTEFSTPPPPPGTDLDVRCSVLFDGTVVIGGSFSTADGVTAYRVARWTGSTWEPLGSGMNGPVFALAIYNGSLVAGGQFTTAGGTAAACIARWTGAGWVPLGTGLGSGGSDHVTAFTIYNGSLVAGGTFAFAGGAMANNIMSWDGSVWSRIDTGLNGPIRALEVYGGDLIAGGAFTIAGDVYANNVARWDGFDWFPFSTDLSPDEGVTCLHIFNSDLIVGKVSGIARWDGTAWHALGTGVQGGGSGVPAVTALTTLDGNLIVGGDFHSAGGVPVRHVALWNGSSWAALGGGVTGVSTLTTVYTLTAFGTGLVAGGRFERAGSVEAANVALWTTTAWTEMGTRPAGGDGLSAACYALAEYDGHLLAGGPFRRAGGYLVERVGEWDDLAWQPVAGGLPSSEAGTHNVVAMTVYRGDPVVAYHEYEPGWSGCRIVRCGVSGWQTIGVVSGWAFALAVYGDELYVGGQFTAVAGTPAWNLAAWNGSAWRAAGSVGDERISAFTVHAGSLYAAGFFAVYRLSGSSTWTSVSAGQNGSTTALASFGSYLAAGGAFTQIGGASANHIALWDGSSWSALGAGIDGGIAALVSHEGCLVAGGSLTQAGGTPANKIALWDGSVWQPFGSGVNGNVTALCSIQSRLYVGGEFTSAGGNPSFYMARWDSLTTASSPVAPMTAGGGARMQNPYSPGGSISLNFPPLAAIQAAVYDLQGCLVRRLCTRSSPDARGVISWDGRTEEGIRASSGVYYLRAEAGSARTGRAFVLIR